LNNLFIYKSFKYGGFTFIEIIVAVALIILGLVPIFTIFGTTASDISITIDEAFATNYANELIEAVMSKKFDEIPENLSQCNLDEQSSKFWDSVKKGVSPIKQGFKRNIEIENDSAPYEVRPEFDPFVKETVEKMNRFKIIRVTIEYSQNNKPKKLTLAAYMTSI